MRTYADVNDIEPTPNKACTIISTQPGGSYRYVWDATNPVPGTVAGSDANNMNLSFGRVDEFGVPIANTDNAPNINGGLQNGAVIMDTSGYQVTYANCWLIMPVGVTSATFTFRAYGATNCGLYLGPAYRYSKRIFWLNAPNPSLAVDMTNYPELCGRKIVAARLYNCNGYFHGGFQLQWNVGAGMVDIPVANVHGQQPSQSIYPS